MNLRDALFYVVAAKRNGHNVYLVPGKLGVYEWTVDFYKALHIPLEMVEDRLETARLFSYETDGEQTIKVYKVTPTLHEASI